MTKDEAYTLGKDYHSAPKYNYPEKAKGLKGDMYQAFVQGYTDAAKKYAFTRLVLKDS